MKLSALFVSLVGLVTLCTLASACSSGTDGVATPTSASSTTESTTADSQAGGQTAPNVGKPLNATAFVNAPCNALAASDLTALHLSGGRSSSRTTAGAPICNWDAVDSTDATKTYDLGVSWLVPDGNGLSAIYSNKSNMAYFEETSVDGYPAVFADVLDARSSGTCVINVGISDSLYFFASYKTLDTSMTSQSCSLAKQAASDVIKNLQG